MELTAAQPVIDYRVELDNGRILIWSTTDMKRLFRELTYSGHTAKHVEELNPKVEEKGDEAA